MVRTTEDALGSTLALGDIVATWDDGRHGHVSNICVYYSDLGVNMIKFCYLDGTEKVEGDAHGKIQDSSTKYETGLLSDEYIKVCIAHCGHLTVRKMEFHTNKRIIECGVDKSDDLVFGNEYPATFGSFGDQKIVGFHGKSGEQFLHRIGVHWGPI